MLNVKPPAVEKDVLSGSFSGIFSTAGLVNEFDWVAVKIDFVIAMVAPNFGASVVVDEKTNFGVSTGSFCTGAVIPINLGASFFSGSFVSLSSLAPKTKLDIFGVESEEVVVPNENPTGATCVVEVELVGVKLNLLTSTGVEGDIGVTVLVESSLNLLGSGGLMKFKFTSGLEADVAAEVAINENEELAALVEMANGVVESDGFILVCSAFLASWAIVLSWNPDKPGDSCFGGGAADGGSSGPISPGFGTGVISG